MAKARTTRKRSSYEVIVGNIGTVYTGASKLEARKAYLSYVKDSLAGFGRAGGEGVVLLRDDDIFAEHVGAGDE